MTGKLNDDYCPACRSPKDEEKCTVHAIQSGPRAASKYIVVNCGREGTLVYKLE